MEYLVQLPGSECPVKSRVGRSKIRCGRAVWDGRHRFGSSWTRLSEQRWRRWHARTRSRMDRWCERESFSKWPQVDLYRKWDGRSGVDAESCGSGRSDSAENEWPGSAMSRGPVVHRFFPPAVAAHLVKLACDLPDDQQRSLSLWTCRELARTVQRDGIVESISAQSVQRILGSYRLKPWRVHYWLNAKAPRDAEFRRRAEQICELYTRELEPHERVLSADEKTSL